MPFRIGDDVFVCGARGTGQRLKAVASAHDPLIIGQPLGDVVPIVVPRARPEAGLPA